MQSSKKDLLNTAVNAISCKECSQDKWCLIREILVASHSDTFARTVYQYKCVEIFKNDQSRLIGKDIGWEDAWKKWIDDGLAALFAEYYSLDKDPIIIYEECVRKKDQTQA
jgi:hypothetical protein